MTIWNSTCNPCFSTFDQICFVFHGLKTGFFFYSLKLNFICYPNGFFTYDYSLWDGGRHMFLQAKTNFKLLFFFPHPILLIHHKSCIIHKHQHKTLTGEKKKRNLKFVFARKNICLPPSHKL
jgi:hypothetical protein